MVSTVNGVEQGPNSCSENWRVEMDASTICQNNGVNPLPTDGSQAAYASFDSAQFETEWIIEQSVLLPSIINAANVSFDFMGTFDYLIGDPTSIPKKFIVQVLSDDGSTIISEVFLGEYICNCILDINESPNIDITSDLAGLENTNVILRFTVFLEEAFAAPGEAMIDNIVFLVDNVLSTSEFESNSDISLYPNPSNGDFNILSNVISEFESIYIMDLTGKVVYTLDGIELINSDNNVQANISSGSYFVVFKTNEKFFVERLIVR